MTAFALRASIRSPHVTSAITQAATLNGGSHASVQVLAVADEHIEDAKARDTLSVDDASITIFRHESLTPEEVLDLLVEHYKAWCVSRPGGRR